MEFKNVNFEIDNGVAYVKMNRPEALNALNIETVHELTDLFEHIAANDEIGAVIVTGEGRSFIAGADIAEMRELTVDEGRQMIADGQALMRMIEESDKPVIAAVNGYSLGGGNELALACHFRIASEKAKFGQPESNLGIIPGYGGTQRLSRLVGKGMAKKLMFTAEIIDAAEAYRIGMVEELVAPEELLHRAEETARLIMTKSPMSIKMANKAINEGFDVDLRTGTDIEAEAEAACFASDDRYEGMTAFIEKREAKFKR